MFELVHFSQIRDANISKFGELMDCMFAPGQSPPANLLTALSARLEKLHGMAFTAQQFLEVVNRSRK